MSDVAETKPDPTTVAPEETKPEETTATGEGEKSVTETATETAKEAVDTAKDAAVKTSDSVFSMFGGGPKKEKKEEAEEPIDEPSGSSKAKKADDEVCWIYLMLVIFMWLLLGAYTVGAGSFVPLSPYSGVVAATPYHANHCFSSARILTMFSKCRRRLRNPPMSTSSPSFT
jgi:hypothetical protein